MEVDAALRLLEESQQHQPGCSALRLPAEELIQLVSLLRLPQIQAFLRVFQRASGTIESLQSDHLGQRQEHLYSPMHPASSFFDQRLTDRFLEVDRVSQQQIQNPVSRRSVPSAGSGVA